MIFFKKQRNKTKGFTLIEMLISISLFSIVTTIAFSALYSIMDANDKAKTVKLVVNNLAVAMESMTREIRVGYDYCETATATATDCNAGSGSNEIHFKNSGGTDVSYKYDSSEENIKRIVDSSETSLVGSDISIDYLKFYILGVGDDDNTQPRVLIVLKGSSTKLKEKTEFKIQTTVSQRQLDI